MVPSILNLKGILRIFNLSIDLDVFRTLLMVPSILNLLRCQNLGQANLAPYTAAISQWWEGRRISEDPMCLQGHASSKHSRSCLSVRVRACVHVCMCVCACPKLTARPNIPDPSDIRLGKAQALTRTYERELMMPSGRCVSLSLAELLAPTHFGCNFFHEDFFDPPEALGSNCSP